MTRAELRHELALFADVVARPPHERERLLAKCCGANASLRARLDRLLAAHERAERDETAAEASEDVGPKPPDAIGPYRIAQRLGEGGMGIVYAAQQTAPIQRRVAIKMLKSGWDSQEVLARFDAERQALAIMNHPNVAQILDAGVHEGRPFFVMDLIEGVPITEFCDEHHMPVRERLELFCTVCEGVQHAHQKGIIHRDIKPSNLLVERVDGVAVPKIIDFGIAKAVTDRLLEATIHTEVGRVIGTPDYMSPE